VKIERSSYILPLICAVFLFPTSISLCQPTVDPPLERELVGVELYLARLLLPQLKRGDHMFFLAANFLSVLDIPILVQDGPNADHHQNREQVA